MKTQLPVRPAPDPGEDLYSLAERTALANGIQPAVLGLSAASVTRRSADPAVLARLGSALGVSPADARTMTLDVYPPAVVGRAGQSQVRTWRLPGVRWVCPRCTPTSRVYLRDWQMALHPLCVTCPSLLQRTDEQDAGVLAPVPDGRAVATQRRIGDVLAKARRERSSAQQLRRLYALVTLVALTADDEWPLLIGWGADLRRHLTTRHDWTKAPPAHPAQAAVPVLECARALTDRQSRRAMVHEGWERLRGEPDLWSQRRAAEWERVLPSPHADGPSSGIPAWRPDTWRAYRLLVETLTALQSSTGLGPQHVPGWDVRPGEVFAPPEDRRAWRTDTAVTTHMLLAGPVHNADAERRSRIALGTTGSGWSTRRLAQGGGITLQTADEIEDLARRLVDDGLIDYAERRHHLACAPDLTRLLERLVQGFGVAPPGEEVLGTWIWVAVTSSPAWDDSLLTPALDLDGRLNPEQRLVLSDAALTYLADVTSPALHIAPASIGDSDSTASVVGEVVA
ncbi:TniQ family protein [Sanguibacter sp. 25GB23B1]|uniref:TniQ family protein n=1 Tax=unclassified Sanguibacter TaxID=2645534 RepID=UPI0032AF6566